jgi:hypothetical protein
MTEQQLVETIRRVVIEESKKEERYDRLVRMLMDKYGVDELTDMDTEEKKDFFSDLESLWDEGEGKIDREEAKEEFTEKEIDKIMGEAYYRTLGKCGCQKKAISEVRNHFT